MDSQLQPAKNISHCGNTFTYSARGQIYARKLTKKCMFNLCAHIQPDQFDTSNVLKTTLGDVHGPTQCNFSNVQMKLQHMFTN